MGRVQDFQADLWKKQVKLCADFGRWIGQDGNSKLIAFFVLGTILIVVGCVGIIHYESEASLTELYIHEDSRMIDEFDQVKDTFGGLLRTQSVIITHDEPNSSAVSRDGLGAMIKMTTPLLKKDETYFCNNWDGAATTRPTECDLPQYSDSLYCNCETVAASPEYITIPVEGTTADGSARTVSLGYADLCESPEVQPQLRASQVASLKSKDTGSENSPTFEALYAGNLAQSLAAAQASLGAGFIDASSQLATAKTVCIAAFKARMVAQDAAGTWDPIQAVGDCLGSILLAGSGPTILGPAYALSLHPAGDANNYANAFLALLANTDADPADGPTTVAVAYGATDPQVALAVPITLSLYAQAGAVAGAVVTAFVSQESAFLSQGNVLAYGYRELARCVAEYTETNRADILNEISALTASLNAGAVAAANTVLNASVTAGVDPSIDSTAQANIGAAYFAALLQDPTGEPYFGNLQTALAGQSYDSTDELTIRLTALGRYAAGVALTDPAFTNGLADLYSGPPAEAAAVVSAVVTAFGGTLATVPSATSAIIRANFVFPNQLMPSHLTLGGVLDPLPNTWGIDRFPCTRGVPVEPFREGDFDYPYAMKQMEEVAPGLYWWHKNPLFAARAADANCFNKAFLEPTTRGIYFGSLDESDYRTENFDAFAAGEAAFRAAVAAGQDLTTAAGLALTAFIDNNGTTVIDFERQRIVDNPSWRVTTEGATRQNNIASTIGLAAGTTDAVSDNMLDPSGGDDVLALLFSFGYHWRPAYGDHYRAKAVLPDEDIMLLVQDAIKNADDSTVDAGQCVLHNTEPVTQTGDTLLACYITWSGRKSPYEIAYGDLEIANNLTQQVYASRFAGTTWNENHPVYKRRIDSLLHLDGTNTDEDTRVRIMEQFEQAVTDFWTPYWKTQTGTGFEDGAQFANFAPAFITERTTSDAIEEVSDINPGIMLGAILIMFFYAGATMSNRNDAVHSHIGLTIWGVVVIVLSTLASFGFASWFGMKLSSLNVVVVPFVSLGIGIDDMFVLAQAYAIKGVKQKTAKGTVAATLADAGPSVTFTSLTNMLAFFIAAATPIFIARIFVLQMAISVVLNWLALLLLFLPALVIDARRTARGEPEKVASPCSRQGKPIDPEDRFISRFARDYYGPLIAKAWFKVLTIVLFLVFFAVMLYYGVYEHKAGLRRSDVAPKDGILYDYVVQAEEKFAVYRAAHYFFPASTPAAQATMLKSTQELQTSRWPVNNLQIADLFWLTNFLDNATQPLAYTTEDEFYAAVADWLAKLGTPFVGDLYCEDKDTGEPKDCILMIGAYDTPPAAGSDSNLIIKGSKAEFYLKDQLEHDQIMAAIRETRALVDPVTEEYRETDPSYQGFVWGYTYALWEQYLHIENDLYFIAGMALLGVFAATFLFQFSWEISLLLCLVILMVDFELYGFMTFLDVQLNGFSLANLVVAIGMAVEFTAHIAHEFLATPGKNRDERVTGALVVMLRPMFHGMLTSVMATCFIAAVDVGFIRRYYFGMFLAMTVIAFFNGLWFLPVVLSLIGPSSINVEDENVEPLHDEKATVPMTEVKMEQGKTGVSMGPASQNWYAGEHGAPNAAYVTEETQDRGLARKTSYLDVVADDL
eukprot:m.14237 g.14237  ORF g.14237 m.14237 type:complete len:1617 (+) comp4765_c0_seq1:449-5299(+)